MYTNNFATCVYIISSCIKIAALITYNYICNITIIIMRQLFVEENCLLWLHSRLKVVLHEFQENNI